MLGVILSGHVTNRELVTTVAAAAQVAAGAVRGALPRWQAARMAYRYVRDCTTYREEGPEAQIIRMPWRFVADGVGDCKSQAIFIGALCSASGCSVVLRFVTLPGEAEPGHVYAVVDGRAVDPLLSLGAECSYIAALDVPILTT